MLGWHCHLWGPEQLRELTLQLQARQSVQGRHLLTTMQPPSAAAQQYLHRTPSMSLSKHSKLLCCTVQVLCLLYPVGASHLHLAYAPHHTDHHKPPHSHVIKYAAGWTRAPSIICSCWHAAGRVKKYQLVSCLPRHAAAETGSTSSAQRRVAYC